MPVQRSLKGREMRTFQSGYSKGRDHLGYLVVWGRGGGGIILNFC